MGDESPRFVMVPREVLTHADYAAVRADRATLGSWLLLYLEADALWPVAPSLPRWLTDAQLEALVLTGLMALDGEDRYRLAIVDRTRTAAKEKASHAAKTRWDVLNDARSNAPSNAPSNAQTHARGDAQPMPTQTHTQTRERTPLSLGEVRARETAVQKRTKVHGFTTPLE